MKKIFGVILLVSTCLGSYEIFKTGYEFYQAKQKDINYITQTPLEQIEGEQIYKNEQDALKKELEFIKSIVN